MSVLMKNIAKGNRKALIQSYEENKDRVFYIASKVDKSRASMATLWAFKNAWNDITSTAGIRDEDFTTFVVHKLANYLQRNSAKANQRSIMDTCEKLSIEFSMNNEVMNIPAEVNAKINESIERIATPVEKYDKTTLISILSIAAVVVVCIVVMSLFFSSDENGSFTNSTSDILTNEDLKGNATSSSNTSSKEPITSAISADIDESLVYYADIDIKDYGKITVKLEEESAPITVANFVGLAESGFYDGLTFHRIIEGFMMQGGDPDGNGTGGSKDNISGEFTSNGFNNTLSHTRGAISMARAYNPNSASSQFFICHADCSDSLDGDYAVFGYVTEGIEVVDVVCKAAKPTDNNGTIPASAQPIITSIKIRTEKEVESSEIES